MEELVRVAAMIQEDFETATRHHKAGEFAQAETLYNQILAAAPDQAYVLGQYGYLCSQTGRPQQAVDLLMRAIQLKPESAIFLNNLGIAFTAGGQTEAAIDAYRKAIDLRPDLAEVHNNLGNALQGIGNLDQAIVEFERAWRLRPDVPEIYENYGRALQAANRFEQAETVYRQAVAGNPKSAEAHTSLGVALHHQGKWEEAIAEHREALALRSDFAEALFNLGAALREAGRLDEAIDAYRKCVALQPKYPEALNNLANALRDRGDLDAALAAYRQASAIAVDYDVPDTNRLYTLYFHQDYDAAAILKEHKAWYLKRAAPFAAKIKPHTNDRSPDRRIRLGYISPDLRDHPVGLALEPLLENHDHRQFEIICFSNSLVDDAVTRRIRSHADHWHAISSLSDDQTADLIRRHQIDILFDLSLHMAHNRLLVFAQKPAPVQVTYLGYPGTTGMPTIDYRLSDPYLDSPDMDGFYVERTLRLPSTYMCWRWSGGDEPVLPPPAAINGFITFGSLNTFAKVTLRVLETWGALLSEVKDSRLILRCPQGQAAQHVLETLGRHGIASSRIEITGRMPWDQYVALCSRQDIGLDPFPYPGHTTSLDSLWLGVPLVTLRGPTAVGRGGATILSNLGLGELITDTPEQYIQAARKLATDLPRLTELRGGLRCRIEQSALTRAPQFAHDFEAVCRGMWRTWCAKA
jgi:protein O-GlcNAc transferase